jgi:hypothetical protein
MNFLMESPTRKFYIKLVYKIMQSCTSNNVINKENADLMWTCPSRGGNGRLFMDFKDLMSSSCQRGDPCPVLFKFKLLINLSAFNSCRFVLSTVTTQTLCILCDNHLSHVCGVAAIVHPQGKMYKWGLSGNCGETRNSCLLSVKYGQGVVI